MTQILYEDIQAVQVPRVFSDVTKDLSQEENVYESVCFVPNC